MSATFIDVFNEAGRASQTGAGIFDYWKDKKASLDLQNDNLYIKRETTLFLQTLQQDGDYDNYMAKFQQFQKNLGATLRKKSMGSRVGSSKYYQETLGGMLNESAVSAEAQVRDRQIKAVQSAGRATYQNSLKMAQEIHRDNPQELINEVHSLTRTALKSGYISYPESMDIKNGVFESAVGGDIQRQIYEQWAKGKTIDDIDEILKGVDISGFSDYTVFNSVWKGYKRENVGKGWIDIHDSVRNSKEFTGNYNVVKKLASDGDLVKMLPEHKGKGISGWKNPDYLINASLWELESPNGSKTSINHAIKDGQNQSPNLIIQAPETVDRKSVLKAIFDRFTHKQYPARVRNLILFWGDRKDQWTADEIRRWEMPE